MATLTTSPVAPLLDRLFSEADAVDPATTPSVAEYWNGSSAEDKGRLVRGRDDHLDLYSRMKDVPPAVSRSTPSKRHLKGLPCGRLQFDGVTISRCVRAALSAGWEPTSRGKPVMFTVDAEGD